MKLAPALDRTRDSVMKIAILNTDTSALSVFNALRVAKALQASLGEAAYLVVGVMADAAAEHQARRVTGPWREVRRMRVEQMPASSMHKVFGSGKWEGEYSRPLDGGLDFRDCDLWLITGSGFPRQLAPLAPYVVFVAEHPWRMRLGADLDMRLGLRRTMRAARMVWINSEADAAHWRMLADLDDGKVITGAPSSSEILNEWGAECELAACQRHLLYLVNAEESALLRIGAIDSVSVPPNCVVPIVDLDESLPGHRLNWEHARKVEPSLETLLSFAAMADGVIIGPTTDPGDVRMCAARAARTPVAMLWAQHLGAPPDWAPAALIDHGDNSLLDDRLLAALSDAPPTELGHEVDMSVVRGIGGQL